MTGVQVILLLLFYGAIVYLNTGSVQLISYAVRVLIGWGAGLIMGDPLTGLNIGATITLMSLGVGAFGGSAIPNYNLGALLGTVFAVTTGSAESGLTVAVTVSMFGTLLNELYKFSCSFFIHKAMSCNEKCDFHGIGVWIWISEIVRVLIQVIPVAIAITVGVDAISAVLNMIPAWFNAGMKVAGGILPGLGFAILMRYMPVQKYGIFMILGFVLSAYLNLPMLAVAALAFVAAYMIYQSLVEKERAKAANLSAAVGGMEDE